VLLHFGGHAHFGSVGRGGVDLERVVELGQVIGLEGDVDHGTDNLNDLADSKRRGGGRGHGYIKRKEKVRN
jgi:hypothetical protein